VSATRTRTATPISTIHGGDRGAITGLVAGAQPGVMGGAAMLARMFTDAGGILLTRTPKLHGQIHTRGTTARAAARHFKIRNAAQRESPAVVITLTFIPEIQSPVVARRYMTPRPASSLEAEPDSLAMHTPAKESLAEAGSLTTRTRAAASLLGGTIFMRERMARFTAMTGRAETGRRTPEAAGSPPAGRKEICRRSSRRVL